MAYSNSMKFAQIAVQILTLTAAGWLLPYYVAITFSGLEAFLALAALFGLLWYELAKPYLNYVQGCGYLLLSWTFGILYIWIGLMELENIKIRCWQPLSILFGLSCLFIALERELFSLTPIHFQPPPAPQQDKTQKKEK